jgi:hypothetical protein
VLEWFPPTDAWTTERKRTTLAWSALIGLAAVGGFVPPGGWVELHELAFAGALFAVVWLRRKR